MTPTDVGPVAVGPRGVWIFSGGCLRSATETVVPFSIDFFERWTYARFLGPATLALAFESSQPWGDGGSYNDRYGGVQVLALTPPASWSLVALEYDYRRHDEDFIPDDVVWHPRGVLAWLRNGELVAQRRRSPRGVIPSDLLPPCDSEDELALSFTLFGSWRRLELDEEGRFLRAFDDTGLDLIDLDQARRARDGGAWELVDVETG